MNELLIFRGIVMLCVCTVYTFAFFMTVSSLHTMLFIIKVSVGEQGADFIARLIFGSSDVNQLTHERSKSSHVGIVIRSYKASTQNNPVPENVEEDLPESPSRLVPLRQIKPVAENNQVLEIPEV